MNEKRKIFKISVFRTLFHVRNYLAEMEILERCVKSVPS